MRSMGEWQACVGMSCYSDSQDGGLLLPEEPRLRLQQIQIEPSYFSEILVSGLRKANLYDTEP